MCSNAAALKVGLELKRFRDGAGVAFASDLDVTTYGVQNFGTSNINIVDSSTTWTQVYHSCVYTNNAFSAIGVIRYCGG